MTASEQIASYLPYLRRFARALSGSQSGGDAYVLETLEAIVAEPQSLDIAGDVRVSLYHNFLRVWSSASPDAQVDASYFSADERGAQRNLEAIAPRPRIAFLLSALEGFSPGEVASILGTTAQETQDLLDQSGRAIADQIRTDVLIIEDEPLIALDLKELIQDLGHRVVGIARTHKEAVGTVAHEKPGLILADILLADGSSGLEAVNEILADFEVPVIFVTAYPERFLTGRPPEPTFLITKPFRSDHLKAVISQALFFDRRSRRKGSRPPERPVDAA
jgi:CheY-like chemotaxis protein/DNA-directed RNA polymerase specialized sigma24 family protein